jgi:hypothetical protein
MNYFENKKKSEVIKEKNKKQIDKIRSKKSFKKESEKNSNFKKDIEFSSISIKKEKEESKSDANDKTEKEMIGKNIIISKINNNAIENNNNNLVNFTDNLYNSEEHMSKTKLFNRKNSSRDNLLNLNYMRKEDNNNKSIYKSSSRLDIPKIYRKSLFSENKNIEENPLNLSKHLEPSLLSKKSNCETKSKNNNYAAFFKLKEKIKRPPKVSYIDSLLNNNNNNNNNTNNGNNSNNGNNGNNSTYRQNKSKDLNLASSRNYVNNKNFTKNIIFSPDKKGRIKKSEEKKEEEFQIIQKKGIGIDIEEKNMKLDLKETQNDKNNLKKIKWNPKKFFCCLNCNLD